jgi:hypothetical protein
MGISAIDVCSCVSTPIPSSIQKKSALHCCTTDFAFDIKHLLFSILTLNYKILIFSQKHFLGAKKCCE